jgi:RNA polymerase sigma factor (sigma-70 family)
MRNSLATQSDASTNALAQDIELWLERFQWSSIAPPSFVQSCLKEAESAEPVQVDLHRICTRHISTWLYSSCCAPIDAGVFDVLCENLARSIYRRLDPVLDAHALVRDVIADVVLTIARVRDPAAFLYYCQRAVRYAMLRAHATLGRERSASMSLDLLLDAETDDEARMPPVESGSTLNHVEDAGIVWRIIDFSTRLSPRERAVVTLRAEHQLTAQETARQLGTSRGAIDTAYCKALKKLRKDAELRTLWGQDH